MEKSNDLHLLYKELGETPNQTILRFKKVNPEYEDVTMTYAGRLDPMAEGLLLVLSGEKLKTKEEYLGLPKTYTFQILWGFSTDTFDVLGMIEDTNFTVPDKEVVEDSIKGSIGKINQSYPPYSSKPVSGPTSLKLRGTRKPLFKWAREGRLSQIEIPKHEVEIINASFIGRKTVLKTDLLKEIEGKIKKVDGDFRQKEILKKWKDVLEKTDKDSFIIDEIETEVSSGFYVRQFVSDLAKKFNTCATTFHIKRKKVGQYEI